MQRRPIIGVMGSHAASYEHRAVPLGRWIAEQGYHLLTGAGEGVMAAVSRAFSETDRREGLVIGVVPSMIDGPRRPPARGYPNRWVELSVYTHLDVGDPDGEAPESRNHINILTSTAVVLLPGSTGTLSEARLAVRYATPCVAFLTNRSEIQGLPAKVACVSDLDSVAEFVSAAVAEAGPVEP